MPPTSTPPSGRGPAAALAALTAALLAACGDPAVGPGYAPPYGRLRGRVVGETQGRARIAAVWQLLDEGRGWLVAAQDIPLELRLGARFDLTLERLPPVSTLHKVGHVRTGAADVVVYEDVDGDGALSLAPVGAATPVGADRVLGRAEAALTYAEALPGLPPTAWSRPLPLGYGLVVPDRDGHRLAPLDTELQIAIGAADPAALAGALCEIPRLVPPTCDRPECLHPVGAQTACSDDGRRFTWTFCLGPPKPFCAAPACNTGERRLEDGAAAPAGWPCVLR
jgi:hypothetical protein